MPTTARRWTVTANNVWDVLDATDTAGLYAAKPHYAAGLIPPSTTIDGITLLPPHVPARTVAYFGDAIVLADGVWSVHPAADVQQADAR